MRKFIYEIFTRAGTALVTPIRFSLDTGHFKSSISRKAINRMGQPLPWYTYPAIDFLSNIDFSDQSVLEFGAGQSTLWWAKRASHVFSIDSDYNWHKEVSFHTKSMPNVELYFCDDLEEYARKPLGRRFDLIIIDGGIRQLCAQTAAEIIDEKGAIILDNSEGYWGGEEDETYPIMDLFQNLGYMRVDFYGYAPGVIKPSCTSIFFTPGARIFKNLPPPVSQYNPFIKGWRVMFSSRKE